MPQYIVDELEATEKPTRCNYLTPFKENAENNPNPLMEVYFQNFKGGDYLYDELLANTTWSEPHDKYEDIFHDLFRLVFTPSPPVQATIDEQMKRGNLIPGEYSVAHFRAFYAVELNREVRSASLLIQGGRNAVNCASHLMPGKPVYFASDSIVSIQGVEQYAKEFDRPIVSLPADTTAEAMHIDYTFNITDPRPYYSIFVDLMIMGNSRCVSLSEGGYGTFALLLGYNTSCYNRNRFNTCTWKDSR